MTTNQTLYSKLQPAVSHDKLQPAVFEQRPSERRRNLLTLLYAVTGLWTIVLSYAAYTLLR